MPCIHGEESREKRKTDIRRKKGARNPRCKEMRVINHTSVVQQSLTGRTSFSIVTAAYDNTQITLITLGSFKLN